MEPKGVVTIMLGIIGTLLLVLAMAEFYGAGWTTVGQGVTNFIIVIVAFALAVSGVIILINRRH